MPQKLDRPFIPRSGGAQSATAGRPARDHRLDFFRGLALVCIFIDHIPNNQLARLTLHSFGFSDAAEVFVLIAGISCALAYASKPDSAERVLWRLAKIYAAHVGLVLATTGLITLACMSGATSRLFEIPAWSTFRDDPASTVISTLALTFQPSFIDILPLYCIMLLGVTAFLRLAARSAALALAVSGAIWLAANAFQINLPTDTGGWFFNPFAWQLLLCIGIVIGLQLGAPVVPQWVSRWLLALAIAFLTFAFLHKRPWAQLPIQPLREFHALPQLVLPFDDKTFLSPWRVFHVLSLAYVATRIPAQATWLHRAWWANSLTRLGKTPLRSFIAVTLLSTAGSIVLAHYGLGLAPQVAVNAGGLAALFLISLSGRGKPRTRQTRRARIPELPGTSLGLATFAGGPHL